MFKSFENPGAGFSENQSEKQEQKTRIVVMLGARLFQEGMGNGLPPRFPLINESKKEGMPKEVAGGDVRMRAIEQLYKEYQDEHQEGENFRVFTTGGVEEIPLADTGEVLKLSRAGEAERKLEEKYGLPQEIVESLPSGGSTLGNAKALAEWVEQHQEEIGAVEELEVITNEFHITRAWLMFSLALYKNEKGQDIEFSPEEIHAIEQVLDETLPDVDEGDHKELEQVQEILAKHLEGLSLRIKPQIAEDILKRRGPSGEKYGELIRDNEFVQEARGSERQGIRDLIHGRYQVR
ncbi:MAG: hypothetical protein A2808_00360 [Candidatus Moranbacteria bacterium RIFCSPHIGHO2_01_FULL_55_24]|nr:MAG: hypothetical protein A2808_00360 [Candidatus Moranbacteria bacterium RIFCSPHIGHO2_01_FULL_55_24]